MGRGVVLITRERTDGWNIESTQLHGLDMVSFEIVSGIQQIPLIGS